MQLHGLFSNGKIVPGRLVGTYVPDEIAVISVAAANGHPPCRSATLCSPSATRSGCRVTAAGRAVLGISATDAFSLAGERIGVLVKAVQDNGLATKAGIAPSEPRDRERRVVVG